LLLCKLGWVRQYYVGSMYNISVGDMKVGDVEVGEVTWFRPLFQLCDRIPHLLLLDRLRRLDGHLCMLLVTHFQQTG
jgi:hypothetical protein